MAEIDDRVVSMHFDNTSFEKKIAQTLVSLDKLQQSLDFTLAARGFGHIQTQADKLNLGAMSENAKNGLGDIQTAADKIKFDALGKNAGVTFAGIQDASDRVNLSSIASAVDNISNKFSLMGAVSFTAIQSVTNSAFDFAKSLGEKALEPILGGGKRRAENIEQARFQFRGLGIDVEKAMDSALKAVRGTAYGLDEAAKIAAQFGASGMDAGQDMTDALRGIAGAAAMTNKSFSEIGDIFASSAGTGVVNTADLQQFATRGLNAAASLAKVWGITEIEVRDMASNGELDFKRFAAAMNEAYGPHAQKANETYSGSLANMRAAFARLGAAFFGPKMLQMRDLFNTLTPQIDKVTAAFKPLNDAFLDISKLGTNQLMWFIGGLDFTNFTTSLGYLNEGIRALYNRVKEFITPIQEAFREIFPKSTVSLMVTISKALRDFMWEIEMGSGTIDKIKRIFAGFFAIFSIGFEIVKNVAQLIVNIFRSFSGNVSKSGAGMMSFTATIADFLVHLNEMLVTGGKISNFFESLGKVITPVTRFIGAVINKIREFIFSFNIEVFGAVISVLASIGEAFSNLFEAIGDSKQVQEIAAFFSLIATSIRNFFSSIDFVGFFNSVTAGVGNLSGIITRFISSLSFGGIVSTIASSFVDLKNAIADLFSFGDDKGVDKVNDKLDKLHEKSQLFYKTIGAKDLGGDSPWETAAASVEKSSGLLDSLKSKWEGFLGFFTGIPEAIGRIFSGIRDAIGKLIPSLSFKNSNMAVDIQDLLDTFNLVLITGLLLQFRAFMKPLVGIAEDIGGFFTGLGEQIDKVFGSLTSTLEAMQKKIKAEALKAIAIALAILVASLFVLSTLDTEALLRAFAAMTAGFIELVGVMKIMDKFIDDADKAEALSKAMQAVATSMLLMALAIKVLGSMSLEELGVGLLGITMSLGLMIGTMALLTKVDPSGKKMIAMGLAMMAIAIALEMMAGVIATWAQIPMEKLLKGMLAVGLTLAGLVTAINFLPQERMIAAGLAMIPLAIGLNILAGAVALFGMMDFGTMMKGIFGVFVALGLVAGAMHAMPEEKRLLASAAAMVVVGVALNVIAKAVETLGGMGLWELAKGLGAMGLILYGMTSALNAMVGALPGAKALLIASAALLILSEVMERLGAMKLWDIIKALGAIAAMITVLGIAAYVMMATGAVVALQLLATALLTLGAALALMGVGATLMIAAIVYMVQSGKEHFESMIEVIGAFLTAIPALIEIFIASLAEAAKGIFASGNEIVDAFADFLIKALDSLSRVIPAVFKLVGVFADNFIQFMTDRQEDFIEAGFQLILALARGLLTNVGELTVTAIKIITKITKTLADNAPMFVDSAVKLIVAFVSAIASRIDYLVAAGLHLLVTFLQGIYNGISIVGEAVNAIVVLFLQTLAGLYLSIVNAGAEILVQFITGLSNNLNRIIEAGGNLVLRLIIGLTSKMQQIVDTGGDLIIYLMAGIAAKTQEVITAAGAILLEFLNGLTKWIEDNDQKLHTAGRELAEAIVKGLIVGLTGEKNAAKVVEAIKKLAGSAVDTFMSFIGANSPSKVFMNIGGYMTQGLALGLDRDSLAENSAVRNAERVVEAFSKTLSSLPDSLQGMDELNPVITPVLDLTKVAIGARGLNDMMSVSSITPEVSMAQANLISKTTPEATTPDSQNGSGPTEINFIQNNNSPKALSTNDIYRGTRSQIALAKEELGI